MGPVLCAHDRLVIRPLATFAKVYRLTHMTFVGNLVPERELGEVGLLDLVESVQANRRPNRECVIFLEDDAKAKVVMFRWTP